MKHSAATTFLYYQIADKIADMICEDELDVGAYLPSERKLSKQFDVAFLTIRKALGVLVEEGIIRKVASRGSLILKLPELDRALQPQRTRIGITIWAEAGVQHPATQNLLTCAGLGFPSDKYEIVIIFITKEMVAEGCWDVLLNPNGLDGMAITVQEIPKEIIEQMQVEKTPKVFINFPDIIPGGWSNPLDSMTQLMNYFMSLGHRNIAYITGSVKSMSVQQDIEAFSVCCRKYDLPFGHENIITAEFSEEAGYQNMLKLLHGTITWDAVLLGDDYMAKGALKAIYQMGLLCPGDISIACHDGCGLAEMLNPAVTAITKPRHEFSPTVKCLDMLKGMVEKETLDRDWFTYCSELVIRESTAVKSKKGY